MLQAPKPGWFTPLRLLIIFCVANIMVYLDRGERVATRRGSTFCRGPERWRVYGRPHSPDRCHC